MTYEVLEFIDDQKYGQSIRHFGYKSSNAMLEIARPIFASDEYGKTESEGLLGVIEKRASDYRGKILALGQRVKNGESDYPEDLIINIRVLFLETVSEQLADMFRARHM